MSEIKKTTIEENGSFFFGLDNHEAVSVFVLFLLRARILDDQMVRLGLEWPESMVSI